jgi:hypothetical protein
LPQLPPPQHTWPDEPQVLKVPFAHTEAVGLFGSAAPEAAHSMLPPTAAQQPPPWHALAAQQIWPAKPQAVQTLFAVHVDGIAPLAQSVPTTTQVPAPEQQPLAHVPFAQHGPPGMPHAWQLPFMHALPALQAPPGQHA